MIRNYSLVTFDMRTNPPIVRIAYVEKENANAREQGGAAIARDSDAASLLVPGLIAALDNFVNSHQEMMTPETCAERCALAEAAEARARAAESILQASQARLAALEVEIATKTDELREKGVMLKRATVPNQE